jgi:hypothetical protein
MAVIFTVLSSSGIGGKWSFIVLHNIPFRRFLPANLKDRGLVDLGVVDWEPAFKPERC